MTISSALTVDAARLPAVLADGLRLDGAGRARPSLIVVDLDQRVGDAELAEAAAAAALTHGVVIGVGRGPLGPRFAALGAALTTTLVDAAVENERWQAGVADVPAALERITVTAQRAPVAARTLAGLLRLTASASVDDGLIGESLAYSMLLAGAEFATWLAAHRPRPLPEPAAPVVVLDRRADPGGAVLTIALNRPERHNAFDRTVRDGLVDAFDLVALDPTVETVQLVGNGPSFCSGGDLAEFGLSADPPLAHAIRLDRSVALRIERVRERVTVALHGAAIGAGIELASFARRVVAAPGTRIVLPELGMGLIPGAGGTVGVTRRIGRWRCAFLALSGEALPLGTALRWGLVDAIGDRASS